MNLFSHAVLFAILKSANFNPHKILLLNLVYLEIAFNEQNAVSHRIEYVYNYLLFRKMVLENIKKQSIFTRKMSAFIYSGYTFLLARINEMS